MKLIDVGNGNLISCGRVVAIVSPESLPVRRLIQDAKNIGRVIDVSCGKKTRAVIITDSDHIILSAQTTELLNEEFDRL
ncbi:MAG TPA: hypothetical protein DD733_04055 [Clostridiales bacterium]|nr:DUF370 domain-containing protein [Eubacteriales bacterium]HBR31239.1 hypothetical protein [Clostridiales bacterium]